MQKYRLASYVPECSSDGRWILFHLWYSCATSKWILFLITVNAWKDFRIYCPQVERQEIKNMGRKFVTWMTHRKLNLFFFRLWYLGVRCSVEQALAIFWRYILCIFLINSPLHLRKGSTCLDVGQTLIEFAQSNTFFIPQEAGTSVFP